MLIYQIATPSRSSRGHRALPLRPLGAWGLEALEDLERHGGLVLRLAARARIISAKTI